MDERSMHQAFIVVAVMGILTLLCISALCFTWRQYLLKNYRQEYLRTEHLLLMERLRANGLAAQLRMYSGQLTRCEAKLLAVIAEYEACLKKYNNDQKTMGNELDKAVLQDALNREQRAKAALVAVLKQQNVPDSMIDAVLDKIDSGDMSD